jgi:serine/threonine protein phosphatase PrpC
MRLAAPFATPTAAPSDLPRPRDDELDLFGLTHPGLVRAENQDQFLLCTVHPQVVLHGTSLPDPGGLALRGQRLATILLVADGVGGSAAGNVASRLATEAVTRYVASSLRYHAPNAACEEEFVRSLHAAAIEAHAVVRAESQARPDRRDMATTLSLGVVVWPWLYVLQVGDSRVYCFQHGALKQVTRDQTIAQDLVERGVLSRERAHASPLSHVLSSAIGASDPAPEVTRVDVAVRGTVVLVCSDGLTKHVTDAEIEQQLRTLESAEQVCRSLLALALERGGTDNVTIVVGRARRRAPA